MTSDSKNCAENEIARMNSIISCQNEKIRSLETKLKLHEEVVSERDSLRKIVDGTDAWREQIENGQLKLIMEQSETCKLQAEELKRIKTEEMMWRAKYSELNIKNNEITNELNTTTLCKNELQRVSADCEVIKLRIEDELCTTKSKLELANAQVNKLKKDLICYEEELCSVRRRHDECLKECKRLNDAMLILETDLKCTKYQLSETKLCAVQVEEKTKLNQKMFSDEIEMKCNCLLNCSENQYNEVSCALDEEKMKVKKLVETLLEVRDAFEKEHGRLLKQVDQLELKYCMKEDELCCMENIVKKLEKENHCYLDEINEQKNKLHEYESKLNQIELLPQQISYMNWRLENVEKIIANDNQLNTRSEKNISAREDYIPREVKSIVQKYRSSNSNVLSKCKCNGTRVSKYVEMFENLSSDNCKTFYSETSL